MSLGAELALAWLAEARGGGPAIYSKEGLGGVFVGEVAGATRLASRPAAGLKTRPVLEYAPPCDVNVQAEDAARIVAAAPLIVECAAAEAEDARALLAGLGRTAPDAMRLRDGGADAVSLWPEMRRGLYIAEGDDAIWLGGAYSDFAEAEAFQAFERAAADEFDLARRYLGRGRCLELRHRPNEAQLLLDPVSVVDAPDERQIAHAFATGEAVFDASGACALAAPMLTAGSPFGFTVSGVRDGAGPPRLISAERDDWRIAREKREGAWRFEITPGVRREGESLELVIDGPSEGAAVSEFWIGAARRRGGWEIWDEADAQLALEESW